MADHDHDPDRQLDLLSGFGAATSEPAPLKEKLAVRWADVDAAGKLGQAAWPGSGLGVREDLGHLREHHRATVLLAVEDDPSELLEEARALALDVRHLARAGGERLAQQASALAADLRAGRRAVVVGRDASRAALPACCALVLLGSSVEQALRAVGGSSALEPAEREVLAAFAIQRARAGSSSEAKQTIEHEEPPGEALDDRADDEPSHDDLARGDLAGGDRADDDRADDDRADDDRADDEPSHERDLAGDDLASDADDSGLDGASLDDSFGDDDEPTDVSLIGERSPAREPVAMGVAEDLAPYERALDLDAIARSPRRARLVGAVLGAAIGDAMGHPTEFIRSFEAIRARYGPDGVTGYELWREENGARFAPYTDDTQMAECVLRSLLAGRASDADLDATMRDMAQRFVEWANAPQGGHRAPGNACLAGCRNLERGVPWHEAGGATAGGCGSVMRAYPFGLVFAHDLERAERWAVAHSKLTHRDPIALAASAAMAVGMARVMRDEPLELVLSEMVAAACRYSPKTAGMMARAIEEAQAGIGPETTLARLEGWAAHEAIAAAVYLFARHADDPRAAILEGANTPGDSDSLATLAGALVGARAGIGAFPVEWARDLERVNELAGLALAI